MNKTLKFDAQLAQLIREGKKNNTWRIADEKNLTTGDIVDFIDRKDMKHFATAKLAQVKETTFGNLDEDDWEGHEKFDSEELMYKTYSEYYNQPITPHTPLKIIRFEILSWN